MRRAVDEVVMGILCDAPRLRAYGDTIEASMDYAMKKGALSGVTFEFTLGTLQEIVDLAQKRIDDLRAIEDKIEG